MGLESTIDHEAGRMITRCHGPIEYAHIREHLAAKYRDSYQSYPELIECSSHHCRLSKEEVRHMATFIAELTKLNNMGPIAVVLQDDTSFGTIRMLSMEAEAHCQIEAFRKPHRARQWLGWEDKAA